MKPTNKWLKYDNDSIIRQKLNKLEFPITASQQEYIDKMVCFIDEGIKGNKRIKHGVAIAANQIGLDKQVIYIHYFDNENKEYKYLLANPEIISFSSSYSYLVGGEGCLSVNEPHEGIVKRHYSINVKAIDMLNENNEVQVFAEGMLSIVFQHEIDHLSGVLFYDKINKENPFYINENWIGVER